MHTATGQTLNLIQFARAMPQCGLPFHGLVVHLRLKFFRPSDAQGLAVLNIDV